ncbi:MAG: cytidine/deoxycytidylate deaminase family protein [Candidatus Pacebacteria bacterium]|nr:cytidine/deoxycytidylate deaminase family protein [Candidatus Paceibacterota bacterium]
MKKAGVKVNKTKRPSWDEYFLQLAVLVGTRGTCDRGHAGTVITKDKRILTTGYVGSPAGLPHCDEVGHEMHSVTNTDGTVSQHCIRTAHAEQNAINNAARSGVALMGATMYTKMTPCYKCAQSIVNVGIVRVVCQNDYHAGKNAKDMFKKAKIKFEIINKEIEKYKNQ